jgi:Tol biopolymer transport system component
MSEFTHVREAVHTLASRSPSPDFGELERRAARRGRRRVVTVVAAAVVIAGSVPAIASLDGDRRAVQPAVPNIPKADTGTNGWIALDEDDDIQLVRPGQELRQLAGAGSDEAAERCPAWSPDGTRLPFTRFAGTWESPSGNAELVIVPVRKSGATGASTVIALDGFTLPDPSQSWYPGPCATWAPDGRWVAFAGAGEVWVVDTQTSMIRRLPDLWPSDLAWRPGTDELAIAGDNGSDPEGRSLSAPVTMYSVSTGEVSPLGSVEAGAVSWSPDGSTLAYAGGEDDYSGELWLVDADGSNARLLVADMGAANHGIGPEWSPRGDRIVYQRIIMGRAEAHEVVLVDVADGSQTVISPPSVDTGRKWYPRSVSWSPDGTTLLYDAWYERDSQVGDAGSGMIVVPADTPGQAALLTEGWSAAVLSNQSWGRQPG